MRASLRERLLGPAVLFALVVLFHWKLVLSNQYTWLESPDLSNLILPWFQFQAGEWHRFRFPLWDPNGWFRLPLFGQGEPGSAYPPNWLLFLVPLKHGWIRETALHWYYVLLHYLAALMAYALAWVRARRSRRNVQMPLHQPNYVRMTANLECRGMVILSDSWYPGWRARVDGKSARIYEAYGGVRGVAVEAGQHVVEMRYRPWSMFVGGLMTLSAAIIILFVRRRDA